MRLILRAGLAAMAALDAVSTLCLAAMLVIYALAWAASWPFAAASRRARALSRLIAVGSAPAEGARAR